MCVWGGAVNPNLNLKLKTYHATKVLALAVPGACHDCEFGPFLFLVLKGRLRDQTPRPAVFFRHWVICCSCFFHCSRVIGPVYFQSRSSFFLKSLNDFNIFRVHGTFGSRHSSQAGETSRRGAPEPTYPRLENIKFFLENVVDALQGLQLWGR